jgi:hypothetical protein
MIMTDDSAKAENRSPSIGMRGHVRPERPVTFKRNQRSNSPGKRMKISMDGKGRWIDNVFIERLGGR